MAPVVSTPWCWTWATQRTSPSKPSRSCLLASAPGKTINSHSPISCAFFCKYKTSAKDAYQEGHAILAFRFLSQQINPHALRSTYSLQGWSGKHDAKRHRASRWWLSLARIVQIRDTASI